MWAEVTTSIAAAGEAIVASPGSETMACVTLRSGGNPGGPAALSGDRPESMPGNRNEGARQRRSRESDRLVVPMTAGNAARGKEATD
jgi:hypothetical protein